MNSLFTRFCKVLRFQSRFQIIDLFISPIYSHDKQYNIGGVKPKKNHKAVTPTSFERCQDIAI